MYLVPFLIGFILSLATAGIGGFTNHLIQKRRENNEFSGRPKEYHIKQAVQKMIINDKYKVKHHVEKPTKYFFDTQYPISFYDAEAFIEEYDNAIQHELQKKKENQQLEDVSKSVEQYRDTRQEVRKQMTELGDK